MKIKKNPFFIIALIISNSLFGQIQDLSQIAQRLESSVIKIYTINEKDEYEGQGSAVIIGNNGICISNYHVFVGAKKVVAITSSGNQYNVTQILDYSTERDLIKFKLDHNQIVFKPVKINSQLPLKGSNVFAMGYPNGFVIEGESTLSTGIISGFRVINENKYIQTTAPFTHGSSGGGLFDQSGSLIGITSGTFASDVKDRHANLNKIIPSSYIVSLNRNLNWNLEYFFNFIKNDDNYVQGLIAYEKLDFQSSTRFFIKHLDDFPNNAVAWFKLGNSFNQLGRKSGDKEMLDAAIECMLTCIDLDSNYYFAWGQLALLYAITNEIKLAGYCALKTYKINPRVSFSNYVLGRVANAAKEYESAVFYLTNAINLASNYDKLYYTHQWYLERAIANAWLNHDSDAEYDYKECLKLNDRNQDALFWYGNFLVIRRRRSEACTYFKKLKYINANYSMGGASIDAMINSNRCQ